MGRRSGDTPKPKHKLVERVFHALDMHPREVARGAGLKPSDVYKVYRMSDKQLGLSENETLWAISEYVSERLACLMAARADLDKALQADRARRALLIAEAKTWPKALYKR